MNDANHVLVVEDNAKDSEAFESFAASCGLPYHFAMVQTLGQARQRLAERQYAIVVSALAVQDGFATELLDDLGTTPLIVLAPADSAAEAVRAMKGGAADCLVKDTEQKHLQLIPAALDAVLQQRRTLDTLGMLSQAMQSLSDSICVTDVNNTIVFVNHAFCDAYGYGEHEVDGQPLRILWPESASEQDVSPALSLEDKSEWSGETQHRRKDGIGFVVSFTRTLIIDSTGAALGVLGVSRDVSGRQAVEQRLKASLQEKEVLLKEVHHRVKNNLQVVSSLLHLQSSYVSDEQSLDVLRDSQNRIKSMALIHERLYRSTNLTTVDFGEYVHSLIRHIKSSFKNLPMVRVETDIEHVYFDVDVAIPCGLIVNELLSNALKHGFKDTQEGGQGCVSILLGRRSNGEYVLSVQDNGAGFPEGIEMLDEASSLGLQLVRTLAQQLGGRVSLQSGPGASIKVAFRPKDPV